MMVSLVKKVLTVGMLLSVASARPDDNARIIGGKEVSTLSLFFVPMIGNMLFMSLCHDLQSSCTQTHPLYNLHLIKLLLPAGNRGPIPLPCLSSRLWWAFLWRITNSQGCRPHSRTLSWRLHRCHDWPSRL